MRPVLVALASTALLVAGCDSAGPPNEPPSVDFSFAPLEPRAGEPVTFTANVRDDGGVALYGWDFDGDGVQDASGPSPTHAFERGGRFRASLTVTDDGGATGQASRSVAVAQRYDRVTVTEVTVVDAPFVDAAGEGWDFTSGPDLYVAAFDGDGQNLSVSGYYEDVRPGDLPLAYPEGGFTVGDLGERHAVDVWDYDPANDDDFVGGILFTLDHLVGEYPSTERLDAGAGVVLELSLEWGASGARVLPAARRTARERRESRTGSAPVPMAPARAVTPPGQ